MNPLKLPPLRLRLLPPAIALIVATTMIPTALRHPALLYIDNAFNPPDLFNNLLLYMPLGIALGGTSLRRALLFGFGLSTCAEILQMGYVDRTPSFLDIACNTVGAVIGYLAATQWIRLTGVDPKSLRISRAVGVAALATAMLGTLMLVHRRPHSDFSNWNPGFHLAIGDELTGGRLWAGTVSHFQIYPYAIAPQTIQTSQFPEGGLLPAWSAATQYGRPLYSPEQEHSLYQALVQQSRLTVLIQIHPADLNQSGPARILTYSQDANNRNFTLGQLHDTLTFRLRTPDTGGNGSNPALYSGPVLSLDHPSFVAAVYDGRISTLYVDGRQVAQADLGARRPRLPKRLLSWLPGSIPLHEIELIAAEILLAGLFALGLFALAGVPVRRETRFLAGLAAGAALGAFIWAVDVSSPALGVRILAECAAAGLVIAASIETDPAQVFSTGARRPSTANSPEGTAQNGPGRKSWVP